MADDGLSQSECYVLGLVSCVILAIMLLASDVIPVWVTINPRAPLSKSFLRFGHHKRPAARRHRSKSPSAFMQPCGLRLLRVRHRSARCVSNTTFGCLDRATMWVSGGVRTGSQLTTSAFPTHR